MTPIPHIKQLLDELYQIEPNLRKEEAKLQQVIAFMTTKKPEVTIPENFKKTLERRLISGINPLGTERRIHQQNSYFRFFWYFMGAGVCASIALSFGFFDYLQTPSAPNIKPLAVLSDTDTPLSASPEKATPSLQQENNSPLPIHQSVSREIAAPEPEKMAKKIAPVVEKKTDIPRTPAHNNDALAAKAPEALPLAMNLMTEKSGMTTVPVSKGESLIAYVGEILVMDSLVRENNSEAVSNTSDMRTTKPLMDSMASDRFGAGIEEGSGGSQQITSTGTTFATIISRAQTEANLVIRENDRPFYTLSTPHVAYISRNNIHTKDTVELIQVYIFPLLRTDGQESTIKEIQVEVP